MSPVFLPPGGDVVFPSLRFASPEGLLAVGGDLSPERLLAAYRSGIFPWYDKTTPILWWNLPERFILFPDSFHIPRSLRRILHAETFTITLDTAFEEVITGCAETARKGQKGTWITRDMITAYCNLHAAGYAHSAEAWQDGRLAGGLYGLALGGVFFGESMFFRVPEASKCALVWLFSYLAFRGFRLVDCQQPTKNLARFGGVSVPRRIFMQLLKQGLHHDVSKTPWQFPHDFHPLNKI